MSVVVVLFKGNYHCMTSQETLQGMTCGNIQICILDIQLSYGGHVVVMWLSCGGVADIWKP